MGSPIHVFVIDLISCGCVRIMMAAKIAEKSKAENNRNVTIFKFMRASPPLFSVKKDL
jgi:hypothetical protein